MRDLLDSGSRGVRGGLGVRRLPAATILLLGSMFACAFWTGTIFSRLPHEALQRLGCAPADFVSLRAWCAITSLPLTWGGPSFLGLVPLVAASLGVCERVFGTLRTVLIFLCTEIVSGLAEAGVLALVAPLIGGGLVDSLMHAPDVGPSAGAFGCLGALVASLPSPKRLRAAFALGLFQIAIALFRPDPGFPLQTLWISDLAHPAAALAGYGWARWHAHAAEPFAPRA